MELVDKFVAVHLRRVVVENNQVNRAVLQILQGKDAVFESCLHVKRGGQLDILFIDGCNHRIIFYNNDFIH